VSEVGRSSQISEHGRALYMRGLRLQMTKINSTAKNVFGVIFLLLLLFCGCRKSESAKQVQVKPKPQTTESPRQEPERQESAKLETQAPERTGDFVTAFSGPLLFPRQRHPTVSYSFVLPAERYFVHVSPKYSGEALYGLIVFTDASDELNQLPDGWQDVLDTRKYLFIAAQNVGNGQNVNRRLGLAVLGALEMMQHYRIDPNRVYAAGFSGGARMSGLLGFYQSNMNCRKQHIWRKE